MSFTVIDEVAVARDRARVYEHGWQSWSPTTEYAVTSTSARPALAWQHVMRFRAGVELPATGFQGEGLLAVAPDEDAPGKVYAAADPRVAVPSIRAQLAGDRLMVSADGPIEVLESPEGIGAGLARFGDREADRAGVVLRRPPTVWCSWYHYFLDVTEEDIVENLEAMDRWDLPVDVVQMDDGWQAAIGDWLDLSPRFTSLRDLAGRIIDAGRRPGIWLAPFIVAERSELAREHPDWLTGDAGTNWEQGLHGLDLTHPAALDYLWTVFDRLRDMGYDYFKLDFLYAGALPGSRHSGSSELEAYRRGLQVIREAVGPHAYLLGCGAPILPSVGLVDAMRVSPDTYNPLVPEVGVDPLRGRAAVVARAWQQGRLWINDADCLVARPAFALRAEWAEVVERYSGLRSFSDRITDLDAWGLETVRRVLTEVPDAVPFTALPNPARGD